MFSNSCLLAMAFIITFLTGSYICDLFLCPDLEPSTLGDLTQEAKVIDHVSFFILNISSSPIDIVLIRYFARA